MFGSQRRWCVILGLCLWGLSRLSVVGGEARTASRSAAATPSLTPSPTEVIDEAIRRGWTENQLVPSAAAEAGEFCRRCFLDLLGRIPRVAELERYEADRGADKKLRLVRSLLTDEAYRDEYARHWASLWTNLLVGRQGAADRNDAVDRDGMFQFMLQAFSTNKPYDRLVYELISATGGNRPGSAGFNGAVNYLAGKLEDGATLATAHTSRLFLGLQVQCTQCHNHPFNDCKQNQFWQLNSFFRQTVALRRFEPGTNQVRYVELANQDFAGEDRPMEPEQARVYYELRNGELEAAFPVFVDGTAIGRSGLLQDINRRDELARLIVGSDDLPRAAVNRMWAHFLGYGFTKPIDDMGPHNPPLDPELLDYLAGQLRERQFDLRQLMEWIVLSQPYGLSSRSHARNAADDPTRGQPPRFSRFYLRQMSPEQLYESLQVVMRVDDSSGDPPQQAEARQQWLRQFTIALGTDEGDETTTFDGTITQTLMMFNGQLMQQATRLEPGSFLAHITSDTRGRPVRQIQEMFLAALGRRPTRRELQRAQTLVAGQPDEEPTAWQDLWWALLNSNEFILIH